MLENFIHKCPDAGCRPNKLFNGTIIDHVTLFLSFLLFLELRYVAKKSTFHLSDMSY